MENLKYHSALSKLFGSPEEINGANRCPTYLYRWIAYGGRKRESLLVRILGQPLFKAYFHHFVADDWSLDLHDHPKRFISVGLKGRYVEITPRVKPGSHWCEEASCKICAGYRLETKTFTAPWLRQFPAEHIHRIRMVRGWLGEVEDCWTFVIVLRGTREWGFWHLGKFIHWRAYVKSETADQMKACGDL